MEKGDKHLFYGKSCKESGYRRDEELGLGHREAWRIIQFTKSAQFILYFSCMKTGILNVDLTKKQRTTYTTLSTESLHIIISTLFPKIDRRNGKE